MALNTREATVPMLMLEDAVIEKLRLLDPEAAMAVKLDVPVLTVIPEVGLVSVADPVGEAAAPVLLRGIVTVTVSPGSRRPLALPGEGSDIIIDPKASAGALMVRLKL